MKRFLGFTILFISAAGFFSCGAVSSSFLYPDETDILAEPARWVYGINSTFVKNDDLTVYLYGAEGGLSKVPIEDVTVSISIYGETVGDGWEFDSESKGDHPVTVSYKNMSTFYTIHVLSVEEEPDYSGGGSGSGGGGIEIIITGP
ncbi:bacterial Ig-like domain-containing protein [Treponema primitia]|uniref:hypothetical protein n=1 Tax=Treponema primitia TaxID=88058 RepID=UPI003980E8A7